MTVRGTLGASMTASANASSIADADGLSTCLRALAQVKSPRAPFDARGSDFGIPYAHEDHFKLRCVVFQRATSELHRTPLRAIADAAKSVRLRA